MGWHDDQGTRTGSPTPQSDPSSRSHPPRRSTRLHRRNQTRHRTLRRLPQSTANVRRQLPSSPEGEGVMTPYYDDGTVTIYHADCREILPSLEAVKLIFTSPPYN